MRFDSDSLNRIRTHLLGPDAMGLIRFMQELQLGVAPDATSSHIRAIAEQLDWISPDTGALTEWGSVAADSCREYRFWLERDRKLPFEGAGPDLAAEHFRGKSVVEIGCGMGANLMSLAPVVGDLAAAEPFEPYVQLGAILREREGLPEPDIRIGGAEALPFDDDQFDVVLCVTAHQYFDICKAFPELARIVRPGGQVLIIGATLDSFVRGQMPALIRDPRKAKAFAMTLVNTLGYMAIERRPIPARGNATTSRPIYPMKGAMLRWLDRFGLTPDRPPYAVGQETCFSLRKRRA